MSRIPLLLLLALAAFAGEAPAENIHQQTARCLARGGADCESVCLVCHPGEGAGPAPQGWNPSGASVTDLQPDVPAEEAGGDVTLCLGCHDAKKGAGNHPVGIAYPRDDRRYAWVPAGPKLFCDEHQHDCRLYCSTCHNPHTGGTRALLRMDNARSALCLACHIK